MPPQHPPHQPSFSPRKDIYDFSPFLTAPAITRAAHPFGAIHVVDIPETTVPSPLAPDISPTTLLELREFLVGRGVVRGGGEEQGREVWESWKRAWDLWNNYFIEGRGNPVWIRREFEKGVDGAVAATALEPDDNDVSIAHASSSDSGDDESDALLAAPLVYAWIWAEVEPEAAVVPGHVWRKTRNCRKVVRKTGRRVQSLKTPFLYVNGKAQNTLMRLKQNQPEVAVRKGDRVKVIGTRDRYELREDESVARAEPTTMEGRKVVEPVQDHGLDVEIHRQEMLVQLPYQETYFTGRYVYVEEDCMWPGQEMECFTEEEHGVLQQVPLMIDEEEEYVEWEYEEIDGLRVRKRVTARTPGLGTGGLDGEGEGEGGDDNTDVDDDSRALLELSEEPNQLLVAGHIDSSAGFRAMKDFPEYQEPKTGKLNDLFEWEDAIRNTVWRPRRVGEKTLQINMDMDLKDFLKNSELLVDGGVDCGHSPYPVLRSIIEYVQTETPEPVFKKKKVWDEVTGTIFNMPNRAAEAEDESDDERLTRIKLMYGDSIRHSRSPWENTDVFPLDIRRVMKVDPITGLPREMSELNGDHEHVVIPVDEIPPKKLREMDEIDPWWVTDSQEDLRDNPYRQYPPHVSTERDSDLLPVDDMIWKEEVESDATQETRYFLTNLHGGTLIVNGMEVKRGSIAGPLPRFAVIECPGGQVAFWWGVGGRNWGRGPENADYSNQWARLRAQPGWEHVGLVAGQVWTKLIRDRKKREREGEVQDDDDQWNRWKRAKTADSGEKETPGPPEAFATDLDELKWLNLQVELGQSQSNATNDRTVIQPAGDDFWGGSAAREPSPETEARTDFEQQWYNYQEVIRNDQIAGAKQMKSDLAHKKQERIAKMMAETKKRNADGFGLPNPKKRRVDATAAAAAAVEKRNAGRNMKAKDEKRKALVEAARRYKDKQEEELAYMASRTKGMNNSQTAMEKKKREKELKGAKAKRERDWRQANGLRAKKGIPPLPPLEEYDDAEILDFIENRKRDAVDRKRAEDERYAAENARRAAEDEQRCKLAVERKKVMAAKAARDKAMEDEGREQRRKAYEAQKKAENDRIRREKAEAMRAATKARYEASLNSPKPPVLVLRPDRIQPPKPLRQEQLDRISLDDQVVIATARSLLDKEAQKIYEEDQLKKGIEMAKAASLSLKGQREDHLQAMISRASVAGQTPEQYAKTAGYSSINDLVNAEIERARGEPPKRPNITSLLDSSRLILGNSVMIGLESRARLEWKSILALVREKGYTTVGEYLRSQMDSLTADSIPKPLPPWPAPLDPKDMTEEEKRLLVKEREWVRLGRMATAAENQRRWRVLCERITEAGDWDAQISNLPDPKIPARNGATSIEL